MSRVHSSPQLRLSSLKRLGLQDAVLGEPVQLDQSRQRSRRAMESEEVGFDDSLYPPGSRPAVTIGDLQVQSRASTQQTVFSVRSLKGRDLNVVTSGGEIAWTHAPRDPQTVYFESTAGTAVNFVTGDGRGVLVVHERDKGVYAYDVKRSDQSAVGTCPEDRPIAPPWLMRCSPRWLREEAMRYAAVGLPFELTVAVGLAARLGQLDDDSPIAAISLLLAGLPDPDTARPQAWFREQPSRWREKVLSACMARAQALVDRLHGLASLSLQDGEGAQRHLQAIAICRDDIECARTLLSASGQANALDARLDVVDGAALALTGHGVVFADASHLRLASTRQFDPSAWWAALGPAQWAA